jgi:hypothetical protein
VWAGLIALLLSAQVIVPAAQASAQTPVKITGVSIHTAMTPSSGSNSLSPKFATAACPTGKVALGGGAMLLRPASGNITGNVMLRSLIPSTTSYVAEAVEVQAGYAEDWALTTYVVCGNNVPGLDLQVVSKIGDSTPSRSSEGAWVNDAQATCPSGKKVIGAGGVVGGPAGRTSFQQIRPNQQGAFVFVQGVEEAGFLDSFSVRAFAVCAKPIQGWQIKIDGTDYNSARVQTALASCPTGQQVIGAGLTKGDPHGRARVESMIPTGQGHVLTVGAISEGRPTYPWNLASWAVCVTR